MAGPPPYDRDRLEGAVAFMLECHGDQVRKGSGTPYVGHLFGVASIVVDAGGDEDEVIAALLHDAVEDAGDPAEVSRAIAARFGPRVHRIVVGCSDSFERPKRPWAERKTAHLERLPGEERDVWRVAAADKLQNARSVLAEIEADGEAVFSRFNGGRDGTLWYYRAMADLLGRLLPGAVTAELGRVVGEIERVAR